MTNTEQEIDNLDCMFNILKESDSELYMTILETDGDEITDEEAIEIIAEKYNLNKME